jgi:hypothetical protein
MQYSSGFFEKNLNIAYRLLIIDPKAIEFANWSTYNYVLGNPIRLVDPDGKAPSDPTPTLVGFIQYEGRGMASGMVIPGVTVSSALGIMMDRKGNVGVYVQTSVGFGLGAGGAAGFVGGLAVAEDIYALSGPGVNGGAFVTASLELGVNFALEVNTAVSEVGDNKNVDPSTIKGLYGIGSEGNVMGDINGLKGGGASYGIPFGSIGFGLGVYFDRSFTTILASGNLYEAFDVFYEKLSVLIGAENVESLDKGALFKAVEAKYNEVNQQCDQSDECGN